MTKTRLAQINKLSVIIRIQKARPLADPASGQYHPQSIRAKQSIIIGRPAIRPYPQCRQQRSRQQASGRGIGGRAGRCWAAKKPMPPRMASEAAICRSRRAQAKRWAGGRCVHGCSQWGESKSSFVFCEIRSYFSAPRTLRRPEKERCRPVREWR